MADVMQRKRPQATPLAQQEWQTLWEDLAKEDATKTYTAIIRMTADAPTTIAALRTRLHPIRPPDPERLARLLKELDSDDFAVREGANRELEKLGDVAVPTLRQTLARRGLSLEMRRRLESLAASIDEISGERLRQLRAIEVLEMLGTAEAPAVAGLSTNKQVWKRRLQGLTDWYGLEVAVCHYPRGASKWNPVEHRLFSQISRNWAGVPLRTPALMLALLRGTRTAAGLEVTAEWLEGMYRRGTR